MGSIKITFIKKLPKNKRFNYTPIYYQGKSVENPSQYPTKFDAYAETLNNNDISGQWNQSRLKYRNRNNGGFNKTIWIIVLILTFIFLLIIGFDLSIFLPK